MKNAYIIVDKDDVETIELLKAHLQDCITTDEDSFSGADFVEFVVPVLSVVFGSQVLKEVIAGLMAKAKIKIKLEGFEYEGNIKYFEEAVKELEDKKFILESKDDSKKK